MGRKYDFNYIVIGSGPAGSAAALALARAKKRVALVEGKSFGGSNINTRDVPYGVTLDFANTYHKVTRLPEFDHQDISFNFPTILAHQLKAIIESGGNNQKVFEDAGIVCVRGFANFLDDHTIAVGEQKFTSDNFILATGAHLDTSTIMGTESVNYLTPETALKIRRLPKAVLVIGGGSTGCEIAEYYAKLGAKTLIAEAGSRLLPKEDAEAGQTIADYFSNVLGITVLTKSKVLTIEQDDISKLAIFKSDNSEKMVRVDCIILATGSKPTVDYGLGNTAVKLGKTGGIKVDKCFQTTAKNFYAIGDCINEESSTERAIYEGQLLASNLINKTKNLVNYKGFARTTNTSPAVVSVGQNEVELKQLNRKFKKSIFYLKDTPAGKIYNTQYGFVKLIANRTGYIVGGCVVAKDAAPMSSEISLAIRHNLTALEIADTPHIANDFSYAIQEAAKRIVIDKK